MQPLSPPCNFAGLELVEMLGSGGFANVYRAFDPASNRPCAVKVLHDDAWEQRSTRQRFQREVEVLGQLTSPYTVQMLDWGEAESRLYIVFELVEGKDLSEVLKEQGPLPEPIVVHILQQVLESLREAHRRGLLHRDLKPENIRIQRTGDDPWAVKVIDFGIARSSDDGHPSITRTGELIGTPHYMAPEQLLSRGLSTQSDIYSLGIVAMELLLGRSVLHGFSWPDQLERLRSGHVFSVPELERITPHLRSVLSRMTAVKPEDRFADAGAVLAAVQARGPVELAETNAAGSGAVMTATILLIAVIVAAITGTVLYLTGPDEEEIAPGPVVRTDNLSKALTMKVRHTSPSPPDAAAAPEPAGCSTPPFRGTGTMREAHGISLPSWVGYVPERAVTEPAPLLILLPRNSTSEREFISESGFDELAEEHGFYIISPVPGSHGLWPFVEATMAQLCVDPNRVFIVGHAIGGRIAMEHKCQPWVRAIVTYALRTRDVDTLCSQVTAPHLAFSSTNSPMDPVEGGRGACVGVLLEKNSIERMEERLREGHGCSGRRSPMGEHEACWQWDCDVPLAACHVDGGQPWPGQKARPNLPCDGEAADFAVAETAWAFFAGFGSESEGGDEDH